MKHRKKNCAKCEKSFDEKDILKSGLCPSCSQALARLFSLRPDAATKKIYERQEGEGNTPCFNTGVKVSCGQDSCEWQDICDLKVAENAV